MRKNNSSQEWTTVLTPKNKFFDFINLKELFHYKDLTFLLVHRDLVAQYKQTILGPFWYLLEPLFTTIVFTVIFGNVAKIPTDGMPKLVFYMSGILSWNFFSTCLTKTSTTFLKNENIFGKVYFPRIVSPISAVISNLLKFFIQFILFLSFLIYYILTGSAINPNFWILLIPIILFQTALLGMSIGITVSALTTKYRDLSFLVSFGIRLFMYATPIVYPLSQVPEKWKIFFILNPMSSIVESFRYAFLGSGELNFFNLGISALITVIIAFFGIHVFTKTEKTFMDRI